MLLGSKVTLPYPAWRHWLRLGQQTFSLWPLLSLIGPVTGGYQSEAAKQEKMSKDPPCSSFPIFLASALLPGSSGEFQQQLILSSFHSLPKWCIPPSAINNKKAMPFSQRSESQFFRILLQAFWLWKHQPLPFVPPALRVVNTPWSYYLYHLRKSYWTALQ